MPRWQAFTIALQRGMPLERVRSELFNAGRDWEQALAGPAVAAFALAVVDAHDTFAERLRSADRPEQAIQDALAAARNASAAQAASPAVPMAERAFVAVLTRAAAGQRSLADRSTANAADQFVEARGSASQLLSAYVGELLGQYARHVTDREAGRLTEGPEGLSVRQTRTLTRQLAVAARELGQGGELVAATEARDRWPTLIADAFARGRRLPEAGR